MTPRNFPAEPKPIPYFYVIVAIVAIFAFCAQVSAGDLHTATLAQWRSVASHSHRLVTAMDILDATKHMYSMPITTAHAVQLVICIDEVAVEPSLGFMSVGEVASACVITLGWRK